MLPAGSIEALNSIANKMFLTISLYRAGGKSLRLSRIDDGRSKLAAHISGQTRQRLQRIRHFSLRPLALCRECRWLFPDWTQPFYQYRREASGRGGDARFSLLLLLAACRGGGFL